GESHKLNSDRRHAAVARLVINLLLFAPLLRLAVCEPQFCSTRVWRHMLDGVSPNYRALELENLLAFEGVTDSSVKEGALYPLVCPFLPTRDRLTKIIVDVLPAIDCARINTEEVGQLVVCRAQGTEFR